MRQAQKLVLAALAILALVGLISVSTKNDSPVSLSIKQPTLNQEFTSENIEVTGEYWGNLNEIKVNGETAERDVAKKSFRKVLRLIPSENKIKVEGLRGDRAVAVTETVAYFDLEGKLELDRQAEDKKIDQEKRVEIFRTTNYEIVRKEENNSSLTAVVYISDFLYNGEIATNRLTNMVKEIRNQNASFTSVSLLIFKKDDKNVVEAAMEATDEESAKMVGSKVFANYEKSPDSELFYLYPAGVTGDKLALAL